MPGSQRDRQGINDGKSMLYNPRANVMNTITALRNTQNDAESVSRDAQKFTEGIASLLSRAVTLQDDTERMAGCLAKQTDQVKVQTEGVESDICITTRNKLPKSNISQIKL